MRLYLSAAYARRDEAAALAQSLRALGAEVVSRWHDGPAENEHAMPAHIRGGVALKDLADVQRCDIFVTLTDKMQPDMDLRGGMRNMEFGAAYTLDKRIWRVGAADHVGHDLPGVSVFADTAALLEHVEMALAAEGGRS